ncbi:hypothetical protein KFE98_09800 [bacterium SCSIO 12741]|nr:hypothetical protein KFE98_09800 [bacterium SCSIO 12741]
MKNWILIGLAGLFALSCSMEQPPNSEQEVLKQKYHEILDPKPVPEMPASSTKPDSLALEGDTLQ